jgi:hypothetical protein
MTEPNEIPANEIVRATDNDKTMQEQANFAQQLLQGGFKQFVEERDKQPKDEKPANSIPIGTSFSDIPGVIQLKIPGTEHEIRIDWNNKIVEHKIWKTLAELENCSDIKVGDGLDPTKVFKAQWEIIFSPIRVK